MRAQPRNGSTEDVGGGRARERRGAARGRGVIVLACSLVGRPGRRRGRAGYVASGRGSRRRPSAACSCCSAFSSSSARSSGPTSTSPATSPQKPRRPIGGRPTSLTWRSSSTRSYSAHSDTSWRRPVPPRRSADPRQPAARARRRGRRRARHRGLRRLHPVPRRPVAGRRDAHLLMDVLGALAGGFCNGPSAAIPAVRGPRGHARHPHRRAARHRAGADGRPAPAAHLQLLDPTGAFIMFAGIYYGGMYGGSTTSILLNTPGESASVATALEGFQMAQRGRGGAGARDRRDRLVRRRHDLDRRDHLPRPAGRRPRRPLCSRPTTSR